MPADEPPELSIVVPMYNEEAALGVFLDAVVPIVRELVDSYEIICVDDGSHDRTLALLVEARQANPALKIVALSRNFGKELALTAGLDAATGRAVIPMDADLQDPPELLPALVAKWRAGYEVVMGVRADRSSDGAAKRLSARWFYQIMRRLGDVPLPPDVGDYRLLDRKVVDALSRLPERVRFMKGMFAWLGFRQATVPFVRPTRSAGTTKYRPWTLWNQAIDGIVSCTMGPLRIWSYLGLLLSLSALAYAALIVVQTWGGVDVPGYASLLCMSLFFNGVVLISLGILGEYVGRIFMEVKRRPLYLVTQTYGLDDAVKGGPAPWR